MFGSLGLPEILFILVLALLIFGPRKLPEIGRTIGRGLAEFRKASTDLKRSLNAEMIEEEMRQSDPRKILDDEPAAAAESASVPPGTVSRADAGDDDDDDDSANAVAASAVAETLPEPEAQ